MIFNSIAYSQITGIQTKTKKEIVKTLLDYPLVLDELKVERQKNVTLNSIIEDQSSQIDIYKEIKDNYELKIENLEEQKQEFEKQLKRSRSGLFLFGAAPVTSQAFSPEIGLLLQFQNKLILSASTQYNNITNNVDAKVGIGIKLW